MSHVPLLPVGTEGMMEDRTLKAEVGFLWETVDLVFNTAQNKRNSRKYPHKPYSNGPDLGCEFLLAKKEGGELLRVARGKHASETALKH